MLVATKDLRKGDVVDMDEVLYLVDRTEGDVVYFTDGTRMEGTGREEPLWLVVHRKVCCLKCRTPSKYVVGCEDAACKCHQ